MPETAQFQIANRKDVRELLEKNPQADILIGIPSYNNARTIGHVAQAVQAGCNKYFGDLKTVIVNSDGGSSDGTVEVFKQSTIQDPRSIMIPHRTSEPFRLSFPYHGIPGKGSAFRAMFEIAKMLNVKACAVVDSDLRSITPEWVELLVKPVLEGGIDFVAPLYHRHKYDGTITNSIVYPLTRSLYGKRVRQPIGGDFGFSGKLASFYLEKDVWESDVARFGIDIWMTTTAIANGFRVGQSFLGAKIHDAKDPGADLSSMLYQVLSSTFDLMIEYDAKWKEISGSEPVLKYGFMYEVGLEPVKVNVERMVALFRQGAKDLSPIWATFLKVDSLQFIESLASSHNGKFHMPDEQWVDIIHASAIGCLTGALNREHLIKSLTPLYMGKTASWILDTAESGVDDVEKKMEDLCLMYESKKPGLIREWTEKG